MFVSCYVFISTGMYIVASLESALDNFSKSLKSIGRRTRDLQSIQSHAMYSESVDNHNALLNAEQVGSW